MSRIKLLLDVVNDMESLTESLRILANAIVSDEPSVESEEKPSTQKTQEVKPVAKTISVEDVRAVLTPISQSGKTAQVKALLI
ncbi:MAG: rRNA biogenesis protein rrp5, partial [Eubacteriales bacterium]|nr:rRNA biogenesis protein rrp5 [Eubacteriales bacterium]